MKTLSVSMILFFFLSLMKSGWTMDYVAGIREQDLTNNKTDLGYFLNYRNAFEFKKRNGLANIFAKLKGSKEVVIAYLGGSITQQEG
jgi:hypothetical protein